MTQLADAPWIREAQLYGMPEGRNVYCPCCHEENPEWFYTDCGDVVGCSECIDWEDPFKDAEDDEEHVYCPMCGEEDPEWFYSNGCDIVGCSECIAREDAFEQEFVERYGRNPYGGD